MPNLPLPPTFRAVGLSGSPTAPSRSAALLQSALDLLQQAGARPHSLSLRELPPQALVSAEWGHPLLQQALARVADSDVVLVATPIYKAAYSGLLKSFLDLLPQDGLRGKVVVPLATGGSLAHLLALDYALKPVLSALGARWILDPVFATDDQFQTLDGQRLPDPAVLARLAQALMPLTQASPLLRAEAPSPFAAAAIATASA